jgi:hypothetical protein
MKRAVGRGLDGSTVRITLGKIEVSALSAQYGDKLESATLSPMGSQEIQEETDGTYSTEEVTVKVSALEFRTKLLPAMPKNGGGNVRMPMGVSFEHPDLGTDSDMLENFRIKNWPSAVENSNAAFEVELKGSCTQVYWGEDRKTINRLSGTEVGSHGF